MDAPAATRPSIEAPEAVYFGNGCFWGRQFDFVSAEKALGRGPEQISAVVGYAGGRQTGPDGKVCYYLADPRVGGAGG
ncbi:PMSR domain-containing protein, partial [Haematococcus lacustris]